VGQDEPVAGSPNAVSRHQLIGAKKQQHPGIEG